MEWLDCIRGAIDFMEKNLCRDISVQDVAGQVYVSPFFLQRGFSLMTGCGIGEYLRSRRLYEAALELRSTDEKIIDISLKYCYDTPESFAKAFTRFHGASPSQVRAGMSPVRVFLPMKIRITVQGGNDMECKVIKKSPFKVIGFQREFTYEKAYAEIPRFWDEIFGKYFSGICAGKAPANELEKAAVENCIGEYGVCIDDIPGGRFRYLIAGRYTGGNIPEGLTVYEFPEGEWAVFECTGKMPEALQSVNTRVFREWLPNNPDFAIHGNANIEWYDCKGSKDDPDYHSAIWIPVKRK